MSHSLMQKLVVNFLILLIVLSSRAACKGMTWSVLSIDCGSSPSGVPSLGVDETDEAFIKTGKNKLISMFNITKEMSTLRFFPDNEKNCYKLLVSSPEKYHIRAGFLYGNYDGMSKPPTFDLQLNGNPWTTVSTSLSKEPVYYEALYPTVRNKFSICLIRTHEGEIPFISLLKITQLGPGHDFYSLMDNKTLLNLQSRVHFIRDQESRQWTPSIYEDVYHRIWKTRYVPEYQNISSEYVLDLALSDENNPPHRVMAGAIEAQNVSDSITLMVDFPQQNQSKAYFVLYFRELVSTFGQTRKVKIYMDGQEMASREIPENRSCEVVTLFPVMVVSSVNVTISPDEGSNLPPIINAMEIYTTNDLESKGGRLQYYSSLFVIFFYVVGGGCHLSGLI